MNAYDGAGLVFPGAKWVKWICAGIGSAFMLLAAVTKLMPNPEVAKSFQQMHVDPSVAPKLGVVILVSLLLYWLPRVALFGLALLTAYLGGAVAMSVLEANVPPVLPILVAVLLWIGFVLRYPRVLYAAGMLSSVGEEKTPASVA